MTLEEKILIAVLDAQREHRLYSGERIRKCPNTSLAPNHPTVRAWREDYPYRGEEDFTLPAIRAVLDTLKPDFSDMEV